MFITIKAFKALIKQAYQGAGLTVGRREERLLFCGGFWGIEIDRVALPNKALAAVIELTGEIPVDGELFKATKEGGLQYEIPETYWNVTQQAAGASVDYTVTNIMLKDSGKTYHVLQSDANKTQLINELFIAAVDPTEMDFVHETYLEGPVAANEDTKTVYWRSEACTLAAFLMAKDDMKEYDLLEYLEGFDLKA